MPPHVCLLSDDLHLLLVAVVNEAPGLVHLLGGGVAAVVVPAHQLHSRTVQPLLAAEIQVPRLARPGGGKVLCLVATYS